MLTRLFKSYAITKEARNRCERLHNNWVSGLPGQVGTIWQILSARLIRISWLYPPSTMCTVRLVRVTHSDAMVLQCHRKSDTVVWISGWYRCLAYGRCTLQDRTVQYAYGIGLVRQVSYIGTKWRNWLLKLISRLAWWWDNDGIVILICTVYCVPTPTVPLYLSLSTSMSVSMSVSIGVSVSMSMVVSMSVSMSKLISITISIFVSVSLSVSVSMSAVCAQVPVRFSNFSFKYFRYLLFLVLSFAAVGLLDLNYLHVSLILRGGHSGNEFR